MLTSGVLKTNEVPKGLYCAPRRRQRGSARLMHKVPLISSRDKSGSQRTLPCTPTHVQDRHLYAAPGQNSLHITKGYEVRSTRIQLPPQRELRGEWFWRFQEETL